MNTLATFLPALHAAFSFFLGLTVDTAAVLQPTLAILIPGAATVLAHRYIQNKTLADTVGTAAGIAYSHMSSAFANGAITSTGVDFHLVKQQAISAGVAAVSELTQVGMAKVTPLAMTALVNGALGKLLASDPAFSITGSAPAPAQVINVSTVEGAVIAGVNDGLAKYAMPLGELAVAAVIPDALEKEATPLVALAVNAVRADASLATRPAVLGGPVISGPVNVGAGL